MNNNELPDYYALKDNDFEPFTDIVIGKKCTITKKITENDVESFLQLSGDNNPIHMNEDFAKNTMFKGRVAHGLLSVMLISSALTRLKGPGNIWLSQEFTFNNPIRMNDSITASLEISKIAKNKTCTIRTICTNQNNETILEGNATSRVFPIKKKSI